jgi:hypothetical protein
MKQDFSYVTMPNGKVIRITKDDILFKKDELIKAGLINER